MGEELYELPKGWVWASLEDISENIVDCLHSTPEFLATGKYCIDTTCIEPGKILFNKVRYVSEETYKERTQRLVPKAGDILFAREGTIGTSVVVPSNVELCLGQRMMMFRPSSCILSGYYLWALTSPVFENQWKPKVTGTTSPHVNIRDLKIMLLPIAPLAEQQRIFTKIEELFTQLDAGVELLKKVKAKLKRYRQAVLKAAVEGNLTKEWREANQGELEPSSVLLERILKQRREKWEAEQLAKMKAQGKTPKDDSWKLKYQEPVAPDTSDLPDLPNSWCWATPEQLASTKNYSLTIGPFGSNLKVEDYKNEGFPLVFVRNIRSGVFGDENTKYVSFEKARELLAHQVEGGDILITKMGDPPGDACLYPLTKPPAIITADCIKWQLSEIISNQSFFVHTINSRTIQAQILQITKGVAQQKVSLGRFKGISIVLPPLKEQGYITEEIERLFSVIYQLEKTIDTNLKRADKLRQTILKQAFEGKIVPQDPNDEPGEKLLERIKAEKAKREADKKPKRQSTIKSKQPHKSKTTATQLELKLDD